MKFLLGGRGRLGAALAARLGDATTRTLDRADYASWSGGSANTEIVRWFEAHAAPGDLVCIASGLLDPAASPDALQAINVTLPRNVLSAASHLGLRVMTFGTILETLPSGNPYVRSKQALAAFVERRAAEGLPATHVRLHTLYGGGAPHRFMFLGQLLDALRKGQPFEMTSGRQLREYHHVEDDASAIAQLATSTTHGIVELSHGAPVTLRNIATHVFDAFGRADLLHLGALPDPVEDNFDRVFARPALLEGMTFRDTLPAIIESVASSLPPHQLSVQGAAR